MNKSFIWLLRVFVIVVGIFSSYVFLPRLFQPLTAEVRMENLCQDSLLARQVEISGVVLKKYRDTTNHYMRMIDFSSDRSKISKTDILMNDGSGAYDFMQPGDSIVKRLNTMELKVVGNRGTKVFILDFGCAQINDHERK